MFIYTSMIKHSASDRVFKCWNFVAQLHDHLLTDALFFFKFDQLFLHMLVFFLLLNNWIGKFFKVSDYIRVNHFDVLVVLCGKMVFHKSDFLTEHFNFLFVTTKFVLRGFDDLFDFVNSSTNRIVWVRCSTMRWFCSLKSNKYYFKTKYEYVDNKRSSSLKISVDGVNCNLLKRMKRY